MDDGLDTAWVDNVEFVVRGMPFETHLFSDAAGCNVPGWVRGGHSGGWCATTGPARREWRRPEVMAFAGYQASPVAHGVTRTFTWPMGTDRNELAIEWAVDCEPDNDFLRVLVDGEERVRKSGRKQRGLSRIPVSPGSHDLVIEYVKDQNVDEGYDDARIGAIEVRSGGRTIGYGGLDGATVGTAMPRGWAPTTAGSSIGWTVANLGILPVFLTNSDSPQAVDGALRRDEYGAGVTLSLRDSVIGVDTKLKLASSTSERLALGLELPAPLGDWFNNGGKVVVLIDAIRPSTPYVLDCAPDVTSPGSSARRLEVARNPDGSVTVAQKLGTCGAASGFWKDAINDEPWTVAAASANGDDPGSAYLEMSVGIPSPVGLSPSAPFSLAVMASSPESGLGEQAFLRYPISDAALTDERDSSTWHVIRRGRGDLDL